MLLFLLALVATGLTAVLFARLTDFSAVRPQAYADTGPTFDLRHHLSGPIRCEGMIHGPTGKVVSRFQAQMNGEWDGARGRLSEEFQYSSGNHQSREWRLQMGNDGTFTATADDVIGTARGQFSGASVRMTYRLKLPQDAGGHVLSVTDWMFLCENGVIVNRSVMRKFGFRVAELIATMRPEKAAD